MSAAPPSLQGNRACALAAIAAGCRFFAGYPITPSSEIAETMSRELPRVGGVFIQMEDEMGSLAAVIGASMGGVKAMTATSGPGFSLMQEHLGYAAMTEVPCVIVDVMRGGPSTGMPTRPAQGDLMQARWGTHGDHPIVALAPASVQEVYAETIRAFNLAERLRTPVVVLFDEVVAHLLESVALPAPESIVVAERKWASGGERDFHPFAETDDLVPPMARPGDGLRVHVDRPDPYRRRLSHSAAGRRREGGAAPDRQDRASIAAAIDRTEASDIEDAEVVIVAVGIVARAARRAAARLAQPPASGPGSSGR